MRKYIAIVLLLFFANVSIAQKDHFKPEHSAALDTAHGKKLLHQCSRETPENVSGFFVVSVTQVKSVEDNFKKILKLKSKVYASGSDLADLGQYGYQYIGLIIHRKKYIYINAFNYYPNEFKRMHLDWEKDAVNTCGGGNGWWGVLYNIEDQSFSQLRTNGSL
ncbi:MAG TPA: hypothetical protein VHE59_12595 [Mucilaginibacter sp.]|nr:hypothetical protein [Mucilaginibacter sp.]